MFLENQEQRSCSDYYGCNKKLKYIRFNKGWDIYFFNQNDY